MQIPDASHRREPDDRYYARRAAEHHPGGDAASGDRARNTHRRFAAAYERCAVRATVNGALG